MISLNMVLLLIIIILLLITILLLILIFKRGKKQDLNQKEPKKKLIDIRSISFPNKIQNMSHHLLTQSCVKVFEAFRILDYNKKNNAVLNNIEWHSWQVSLLLEIIKQDKEIFIPNPKAIIHESITSKPFNKIEEYMQKIFIKYQNNVNINNSRDQLSRDLIWSVREVSIIFYYMALKKNR